MRRSSFSSITERRSSSLADLLTRPGSPSHASTAASAGPRRMQRSPISARRRRCSFAPESGGEGRNIQFCNTLINFDVPWNPMAIEQRIGRIDRIGQNREVFVFNLVTRGTLEEQVLRAARREDLHV